MNRAFIFDLDGVVVDTAKYHYLAWKELAASLGYDFPKAEGERLKGVSRMRSLEIMLESCSGFSPDKEEKEKLAERKNNIYLGMIARLTPSDILPGIEQFLKILKEKGYQTALGSASKSGRMILEKLQIAGCFDVIVDGHVVQKAKPDPEVFLKAAELLGTAPESCVVIEDAKVGIEAAKAGGMHSIGIGEAQYLKEADIVFGSTKELLYLDFERLFTVS